MKDIPLLAEHCLRKQGKKINRPILRFSPQAMERLCEYDYPGNVRELENLIERALILSAGPWIEVGEWLLLPRLSVSGRELSKLEQLERNQILKRIEARGESCFGG